MAEGGNKEMYILQKMRKKRFSYKMLIFMLGWCFLIAVFCRYSGYKTAQNEFNNRIITYEYLDKNKCWYGVFKTTAYTLHHSECGKFKGHKEYGLTYSGTRATIRRTVAVDPKIVPLNSILIDYETGQKYIAEDTGSAVKGYSVDIFIGEGTEKNRQIAKTYGAINRLFIVIE